MDFPSKPGSFNRRKKSIPPDSLTLSQLKQIIRQNPNKNKNVHYLFTYGDTDALPREFDDFFSYSEMNSTLQLRHVMDEVKETDWTKRTSAERKDYIEVLLETLELKIGEIRHLAAKELQYIALGTFGECNTPHEHLKWIIENNKMLRSCGALVSFYQGLKLAYSNYEKIRDTRPDPVDSQEDAKWLEDIGQAHSEIELYLTLIYFLVETHCGEKKFGDELAALDTPILEFLFKILPAIKFTNGRNYCVKKLVLVVWKTLLAMLGGFDNIELLKNPTRSLNNLPLYYNQPHKPKTTPFDYHHFCFDTSLKFPSFFADSQENPLIHQFEPSYGTMKKDSYNQPFVLPLSHESPAVPESILEAKETYEKFMYISPGMIQMHKETELVRRYERGFLEKDERFTEYMDQLNDTAWKINAKSNSEQSENPIKDEEDKVQEARKILTRIENLYTSTLPKAQKVVVFLLKMLLATITGANGNNNSKSGDDLPKRPDMSSATEGFTSAFYDLETFDMKTIETIEHIRTKEIMSKAVSAIILLLMKYYKLNHILKFEHFSQLLLDSNCLLLILKIFSVQDVTATTGVRNDIKHMSFMQYSRYSSATLPLNLESIKLEIIKSQKRNEDKYRVSEGRSQNPSYAVVSWRNMFSAINLLRILQKLTKRKKHRILLTVLTYKSTNLFKRILKVTQPQLQLYALKFLKSQIPYLGKKWRQSNMKLVTSVYMYCRPELKEDWMNLIEGNEHVEEAMTQEQSLRTVTSFYNEVRYPQIFQKVITSDERNPSSVGSMESFLEHNSTENEVLDENFKLNYEKWLQDEVFYNTPPTQMISGVSDYYEDDLLEHAGIMSPKSPDASFHFFDYDDDDNAANLTKDLSSESIGRIEREIKAKHEMKEEEYDLTTDYLKDQKIEI